RPGSVRGTARHATSAKWWDRKPIATRSQNSVGRTVPAGASTAKWWVREPIATTSQSSVGRGSGTRAGGRGREPGPRAGGRGREAASWSSSRRVDWEAAGLPGRSVPTQSTDPARRVGGPGSGGLDEFFQQCAGTVGA